MLPPAADLFSNDSASSNRSRTHVRLANGSDTMELESKPFCKGSLAAGRVSETADDTVLRSELGNERQWGRQRENVGDIELREASWCTAEIPERRHV